MTSGYCFFCVILSPSDLTPTGQERFNLFRSLRHGKVQNVNQMGLRTPDLGSKKTR